MKNLFKKSADRRQKENNVMEIDYDKLGAAVAKSLQPSFDAQSKSFAAMEKNLGTVADTLVKLPPATETAGTPVAVKPPAAPAAEGLTLDAIGKLIDTKLSNRDQQAQTASQRDAFVGQHLSKLPAVYQKQLGNDPTKWEGEAKAIQAQYEQDFGKSGAPGKTVGAPTATGSPPAATLDASKLTADQFAQQFLPKVPGTPATVETKA